MLLVLITVYSATYCLNYLFFPYGWLDVSLSISFGFITLVFLFSDKILLTMLGARETVESLHTSFFQRVKHLSFKIGVQTPKVYIYKGKVSRIFTLVSRKQLSLVFEYKLIEHLNTHELDALVSYMLASYKAGGGRRRTFSYLVSSFCIKSLYEFKALVFKVIPNKDFSNAVGFITGLCLKPLVELMFFLSFTKSEMRRIDNTLSTELPDIHFLRSALTKLSYRNFNKDLLGKTIFDFVVNSQSVQTKFVDIFEVFPTVITGLKHL
jgi:hypothetical protein